MAHAILRLLARPKITAVFWESLILESSVLSSQFSVFSKKGKIRTFASFRRARSFPAISRQGRGSNAMNRLLTFFHGIAQHHRPAVRATHWAIGFRQRVQQPFHFRLFERHVHFDRRVAGGG